MAMAAATRCLLVRSIANPALLAALQHHARLHGSRIQPGAQLFFEKVYATPPATPAAVTAAAPPPKTAVVLHGLLGSGRNLKGMVDALCRQAAEQTGATWQALLVDLRNHGRSARVAYLQPPHDLRCAAHDVVRLLQHHLGGRTPEALIGHSMGGKTALEVVRQLALLGGPVGQPQQVWVLDARPTALHGTPDCATRKVQHVLSTVQSIQLPLASREALYQQLKERGFSTGLQQWLGSNLRVEGKGRYVWTFNVEGAAAMFADYLQQDCSALLKSPPRGVTIHILRAMRSDRWDHNTLALVQEAVVATAQPAAVRGQTQYHELPDAGHWVHMDNPKGLVETMLPSLVEAARH